MILSALHIAFLVIAVGMNEFIARNHFPDLLNLGTE